MPSAHSAAVVQNENSSRHLVDTWWGCCAAQAPETRGIHIYMYIYAASQAGLPTFRLLGLDKSRCHPLEQFGGQFQSQNKLVSSLL